MVKNPPVSAGDADSIPGSGRSPGEGNANPLQHSCLENSMVREAWRAIVYGITVRYNRVTAHTYSNGVYSLVGDMCVKQTVSQIVL